ncbi:MULTISPECIES: hypothetical protein [unclassified Pigmentiphaga]|uniref:hypothetical protein n=1 Tax=unclassified Pigmentiphaga TaxID=2626614 RepID=UPI000B417BE3|nr:MULTISPECIES: hypothetical protein [unclassified Pigmentiphaga]OVZ64447.1 hypothetical protein CDO46_08985 [Pigmentiphaga sp. NML030171]
MRKILLASALCATLAGCATVEPAGTAQSSQSLAAAQAAFQQIQWGFLQPYIGHLYVNDDGDWLQVMADPAQGALAIRLYTANNLRDSSAIRLLVRPTAQPDTYHMLIEQSGMFSDDQATIRFDESGRMKILNGSLNDLQLSLADAAAHFSYRASAASFHMRPKPLRRDVYTLPDGGTIPVSLDPASPYQQLRAASPFGIWEQSVGQTFVSRIVLLKIDKDDAGNLVFQYSLPDGSNPGREVFQAPSSTDPRALRVLSMPNRPAGSFDSRQLTLSADDRLIHRFTGTENIFTYNGDYLNIYINRGDSIRIMSRAQGPDDDSPSTGNNIYLPVTRERLAAAMENRERQQVERERDRIYAQRRAAERAAESQATTNAILSGLASGFQQANQSNQRMAQQSRDFERDLNQKLRQIEQQKQQRDREAAAHADRIMAANAAAAQTRAASAPTSTASSPPQRTAAAAPAASASAQEAQRKQEEQRKAEEARAAEQARLAKEKQREEETRRKAELARQEQERRTQALLDHLAAERRAIRLQAAQCPAKGGLPSVIGIRPRVQPKVANCITVHFEARCPADRPGTGMTGSIWAYNGMGNCTETGDLPRKLACDVREAVVEVTNVTTCQ